MMDKQFPELLSLEARWFLKSPVPPVLEDIFKDSEVLSRTDRYWTKELFGPTQDQLCGIKIREGGFEIKSLIKEITNADFSGTVQMWRKVRRELRGEGSSKDYWLDVTKNRKLLFFNSTGHRIPSDVKEIPSEGCTIELTTFGSPLDAYFTIGLESYGSENSLFTSLQATYKNLISQHSELLKFLTKTSSKSYPEWLVELKEHGFRNM